MCTIKYIFKRKCLGDLKIFTFVTYILKLYRNTFVSRMLMLFS